MFVLHWGGRDGVPQPTLLLPRMLRKATLTTHGLQMNKSLHLSLKRTRFSETPMRPSSSSITYDRTFDHTSAGSGLTGRGRGNRGSKRKLPGWRESGLGFRKTAGDSVYTPARLILWEWEPKAISWSLLRDTG